MGTSVGANEPCHGVSSRLLSALLDTWSAPMPRKISRAESCFQIRLNGYTRLSEPCIFKTRLVSVQCSVECAWCMTAHSTRRGCYSAGAGGGTTVGHGHSLEKGGSRLPTVSALQQIGIHM